MTPEQTRAIENASHNYSTAQRQQHEAAEAYSTAHKAVLEANAELEAAHRKFINACFKTVVTYTF